MPPNPQLPRNSLGLVGGEPLGLEAADAQAALDALDAAEAIRLVAARLRGWQRDAVSQLGPGCIRVIGRAVAAGPDGRTPWPVLVLELDRAPYRAGQRRRLARLGLWCRVPLSTLRPRWRVSV